MGISLDLSGQKFGRLTAVKRVKIAEKGKLGWLCNCDCGESKVIETYALTHGSTRSCGCLRKEMLREKATTHGHYYEKLHGVWNSMKQRCSNPNSKDYQYYGARGVRVCKEWEEYASFRAWAMASGYKQGLTIDRVNVNGLYCPENCRWVSLQDQMWNRRTNLSYKKE